MIVMRELNVYTLIGDMFAGVLSACSTFVGYDEVAHHSGVESTDAFDALHNLGLVYSSALDERASLEQIEATNPGLLDGLAQHEGIGFVLVRSEAYGPVVIGAQGRSYLVEGHVEGEDPLALFGPNAAAHLRRTDGFVDAPDILVNSFYDPEREEVAAFEELIGSHGGLGGWQTAPFVMYPVDLPAPQEPIVGAAGLHAVLKGWAGGQVA